MTEVKILENKTPKEKLAELLREAEGKCAMAAAEHLLRNGVMLAPEPDGYDYGTCPNKAPDGCSCLVLANMICKNTERRLPCGFFPEEQRRRKELIRSGKGNCFGGLEGYDH